MGKTTTVLRVLQAAALFGALAAPIALAQQAPAATKAAATSKSAPAAKPAKFDASGCFGCHAPVKEFHDSGKHKGLACTACHSGIENHLGNPATPPGDVD